MHEGLMILSQETINKATQFRFCNRTARKLIKTFLHTLEGIKGPEHAAEVQKQILLKNGFCQIKMQNSYEPNKSIKFEDMDQAHTCL